MRDLVNGDSHWVLSCMVFDSVEIQPDGTEIRHRSHRAHDWFLAVDMDQPTWMSDIAFGLEQSRWSDGGGSNGCPFFYEQEPPPMIGICQDSDVTLRTAGGQTGWSWPPGVPQPTNHGQAVTVHNPGQLSLRVGNGRTLMDSVLSAPSVIITAHTESGVGEEWTLQAERAGFHTINLDVRTLCPAPLGGDALFEEIQFEGRIFQSGEVCDLEVYSPGMGNLRFFVGFTSMPTGLSVGDPFYGGILKHVQYDADLKYVVAEVPESLYGAFEDGVSHDSNVKYCTQGQHGGSGGYIPTEAGTGHYNDQWGMPAVDIDDMWDTTLGGTGKTICIVDSGLDFGHNDSPSGSRLGLTTNTITSGTADDDHGHGTFVTSLAAGTINNGGIAGTAQAHIMVAKALDSGNGFATWAQVVDAIDWCDDNGADIISMSLIGFDRVNPPPTTVETAVDNAYANGRLLVAVTGNDYQSNGAGMAGWPGRYDNVIAVGATDDTNARAVFSDTGASTELVAPGEDIIGACPPALPMCGGCAPGSGYCDNYRGTSFAAPLVSGVAAAIWDHVPSLSRDDLRQYLQCTATDLGSTGRDNEFGFGLLDADDALEAAVNGSCSGSPCSGSITVNGSPADPSLHVSGPATVEITHTGSQHVSSITFTASDGATVISNSAGHDEWRVYVGDYNTRYITATADLGTPAACTVTGTWKHTN